MDKEKEKFTEEKWARMSWPLLLSEEELIFLGEELKGYHFLMTKSLTPQITALCKERGLIIKNKAEIFEKKITLRFSLFGRNLFKNDQEKESVCNSLERVIVVTEFFDITFLYELVENFTLAQSSLLYIALGVASAYRGNKKVCSEDIIFELTCIEKIITLSAYTQNNLIIFKKFFCFKRKEFFFFPLELDLKKETSKKIKKVYSFPHVFAIYYLEEICK